MRNVLVSQIRHRSLECALLRDRVNAMRNDAACANGPDERTNCLVSMARLNKQANDLDGHISDLRDRLVKEYGG